MCRLSLRQFDIGLRFAGVNDVGKLDAVLDEEDGHVVSDQVEGSFVGVELDRETAGVADCVGGTTRSENGRESHENRCPLTLLGEKSCLGHGLRRPIGLERSMCGGTACVHDALRNPLVVEVGNLLAKMEVLEQRRASIARLERMIGVG